MGQRYVGEKRLFAARLSTHEVDGFVGEFAVNQTTFRKIIRRDVIRGLSDKSLHDVGHVDDGRVEAVSAGEHRLIGGARNAVPLIKAALVRKPAITVAEMPLTEHARRVTGVLQNLRKRALPRVNALRQSCRNRLNSAGANRMPPCHQRGASRHAVAFDIEVLKTHALLRQRINSWRRCAAQCAATVAAQLAPA